MCRIYVYTIIIIAILINLNVNTGLAEEIPNVPDIDVQTISAKLTVAEAHNAVLSKRGMLYIPWTHTQNNAGAFIIEGEQVSKLEHEESSNRMYLDLACSNGAAVINALFLEYEISILENGKYQVWYYCNFPTTLNYRHTEQIADAFHSVVDSDGLAPNEWRWHKGPIYELAQGTHLWTFPSPHAFRAGAKLDKAVFIPVESTIKPEDVIHSSTTSSPRDVRGTIALRRIRTKLIAKWMLSYELALNGGTFCAEYSYDGQKFAPIILEQAMIPPENKEYLYIKFQISSDRNAKYSPFVYNLDLRINKK